MKKSTTGGAPTDGGQLEWTGARQAEILPAQDARRRHHRARHDSQLAKLHRGQKASAAWRVDPSGQVNSTLSNRSRSIAFRNLDEWGGRTRWIRLPELSKPAAEAALAEIWRRLEEHGIDTPNLDIVATGKETVVISILFDDAAEQSLVLGDWADRGLVPADRVRARSSREAAKPAVNGPVQVLVPTCPAEPDIRSRSEGAGDVDGARLTPRPAR